jgi:hypothetical protein
LLKTTYCTSTLDSKASVLVKQKKKDDALNLAEKAAKILKEAPEK